MILNNFEWLSMEKSREQKWDMWIKENEKNE